MPSDAEAKLDAALSGEKPQESKPDENKDTETEEADETETDEETDEADEAGEDESEDEESEEESEGEDDEEAEESDEEESSKSSKARKPRKYIPKDDYDRRAAAWKQEKAELLKKLDEASRAKPSDARKNLIEKLKKADPTLNISNIELIINGIMEEVKETVGKVPAELQEKLDAIEEFRANTEGEQAKAKAIAADRRKFSEGWKDLQPELKKAFPNITSDELESAKDLLGKIWRTKEFHKSDVYRVFTKNRDKFDELMSPHEDGLETGRPLGDEKRESKGTKLNIPSNPTKKVIDAAEKKLAEAMGESDDITALESEL